MSDCKCRTVYIPPYANAMSVYGIVHMVNGCYSSGETSSTKSASSQEEDAIKAVIAVHKLHKPYSFAPGDIRCSECWTGDSPAAWPCNTIKALGE